ncbi:MAG: phytoene desaturase family protein [Thermoanaerobaculia bacterium]
MEKGKKILIEGAGPGGLAAGMLLAHRGFEVHIFEKEGKAGGRNCYFERDGFKFDIGPTFLMLKSILEEVFEECNKNASSYLKLTRLSPMYRLYFYDKTLDIYDEEDKMLEVIEKNFPGNGKGFENFLKREKVRFEKMYPCLQKSYSKFSSFFSKEFLSAIPYLSLGKSMYQELGKYFDDETLKISFTFQSKYLGMSPWSCPAAFMIIPYIEHRFGIYHTEGGLSEISSQMARAFEEEGGKIHYSKKVNSLIIEKGKTKGIELEEGEKILGDEVILNADFGYSMTKLVPEGFSRKYSRQKLLSKLFSCSTFMLYLGLDKIFDLPHHNIIFSRDYKKFIQDVADFIDVKEDLSIYVRNASLSDKTLAPEGMSNIYILVPVPNNKSKINWEEKKQPFKELILKTISERTELKDIENHIVIEKIITPQDWEDKFNVFLGATFNLGHNLSQMLYFRPHNQYEEFENLWLVGGGTHPGSGLPTIYESGRITANLISKKYKVKFKTKNLLFD